MERLSPSPRAARTRSALLSAGVDLLVERPVDAIAIDEFVAAARVAKGSFFNHFTDKRQFATAIAKEIRIEVEQWVAQINAGVSSPLERLAGGMVASAAYALTHPHRTTVLARSFNGMSLDGHPINAGLLRDLREAVVAREIDLPSEQAGVLYWLGSCQALMGSVVDSGVDFRGVSRQLTHVLQLGLRGLGASDTRIAEIVGSQALSSKLASVVAKKNHLL